MERRHGKFNGSPLVRIFKLRSSEGQTYPCYKIINNILNVLTTLETNLLSKGLTFVQTPEISKAPILEATKDFGRKLKIKYFFRYEPQKSFISKSNWVPPDKGTDPDLIECINNFTKEIDELHVLREKSNLTIEEQLTLNNLRKNKVIKKADKGSVVVIMDKKNYITED